MNRRLPPKRIKTAADLVLAMDHQREPSHRNHERATESTVGSMEVNIICGCGAVREYSHDEVLDMAKQARRAAAEGIRKRAQ